MEISGAGANPAMLQQMRERIFARADQDRSGALSLREFGQTRQNRPGGAAETAGTQGARPAAGARISDVTLRALLGQQEERGKSAEAQRREEANQPVREALSAYGRFSGMGFGAKEQGLAPRAA